MDKSFSFGINGSITINVLLDLEWEKKNLFHWKIQKKTCLLLLKKISKALVDFEIFDKYDDCVDLWKRLGCLRK